MCTFKYSHLIKPRLEGQRVASQYAINMPSSLITFLTPIPQETIIYHNIIMSHVNNETEQTFFKNKFDNYFKM